MFRRTLLLLLTWLTTNWSWGEALDHKMSQMTLPMTRPMTEHLLIDKGLSNNYITDIVQDGHGRIWVGTESGLNSYDGYEFRSYNTYNSQLNSNMINTLWYDQNDDRLWIGTKGSGVCVMDLSTCEIVKLGENNPEVDNIMHIMPDAKNGLWIVSQTSILHWDKKKGNMVETFYNDSRHGFFRCAYDHGDGILMIGHYLGGVSLMDIESKKLRRPLSKESQLYNESINDVVKDHKNRTWLATGKGLWYYTQENDKLEKFEPLAIDNITDIELIDGGEIWCASNAGVFVVDLSAWTAYRIPNLRNYGSPTNNVRKIYQDSYANVWFGSMGNGIDFFSHEPPPFFRLCQQSIWGIFKDADGVWAGTTDRLLCFRDTTLVREIPLYKKGWEGCFALSINSDDQGRLMVSYFGHLLQIDKQSGAVREILHDDGSPIFSLTFYKDQDGTLWITTREGICTYRQNRLLREEKLNSSLLRQSVNGIRRDRQGKLWVATYENGIYLFDNQKRLLKHLNKRGGFLSNSIQHLHIDPRHGIWLSTPDGMGCVRDTNYPEEYETYSYEQGLKDSYIRAIQEDAAGHVWVSTNNGISLLKADDGVFVNFNKYDGIPTNNFTGGAVEYGGGMYFTSLDGLCYFRPEQLSYNQQLSSINVMYCLALNTARHSANKESSIVAPHADGTYHLSYNQNTFRIIFGLSDYSQSRQAQYQYILKGKDADWINISSNAITFRNMQHGHYTIIVRARLKVQEWSEAKEMEVHVYIRPPLWKTWWAYLTYMLLFAVLGWGFFYRYKHRLKLKSDLELERQKNLDEQQRNTERLQFFTNITHELRTPLTLILGPLEELNEDKSLPTKAKERITIIRRSSEQLKNLITQLLEFRKTETHNRQLIVMRQDMRQTLQKVGQNFSELNTNAKLHHIVNIGDTPQFLYYDENVITTILNNLMSNAVKYTPEGEIELSLTGNEQHVVITVRDTGYGITADALPHIFDRYYQAKGKHQASGTGIGLAIVRSLCTLHEADISVESQENKGTIFTLTLQKEYTYPHALHKDNDDLRTKNDDAIDTITDEPTDKRPVILIVEDNTEIRRYIASSLTDDYQVVKASDGQKGCDKAFEFIPDLIITDIMMPVMNGIELCQKLKQDIRTSHIPIIMLTAKDTQTEQQEGYEVGADSYLTKPFIISMLRSRIANLLEARKRLATYLNAIGAHETDNDAQKQETGTLSNIDRQFLDDVTAFIKTNISNPNLTIAMVGDSVNMSHSTLYRKIKALTGLSGNEFIRKVRLHHSLDLMLKKHHNVSEAAYESGFSNLPYFRACFKEEFGMTPKEYLKNL